MHAQAFHRDSPAPQVEGGGTAMTLTSGKLETAITRRDLFALAGTATGAAGLAMAGPTFAQAQGGTTAPSSQDKRTVTLDRLPMGVLLIGIDRVQAQNRIDIPTFNALGQAYYEFERDTDLRVAVLYGKGPDFSRGLDPLSTAGPGRVKPLVVAVQGHVTRIAHELFLAADVRVAAQDTVFNQGEVTAASFPGGGATVRFVREAGWANAMRYMLTGQEWRADDAYRMGLVQELTAPGQQLDSAIAIAKQIAAAGQLGVRA